jgi:hypothetical protein
MDRKSIWDRMSDLDLVEGAIEHLSSLPDEDRDIVSARALLLQLKQRIEKRDKEGVK